MFLLVSGRHVGAHPHGRQHGVAIQIFVDILVFHSIRQEGLYIKQFLLHMYFIK